MVKSLMDSKKSKGFVLAVKRYTVPVYLANRRTRRHDVEFTSDWAPAVRMKGVPIPSYAEADPGTDGHMAILDVNTGMEYDFWEMRKEGGKWKAGWGNRISAKGNGIFPGGLSARGSGFALLAGVIWPHELARKRIKHALIFSYDHAKAGGPVPPATESDGKSNHPGAIPYGARVQLDPRVNLRRLNLSKHEYTIALCLQEYGMVCADTGGGLQLYAVNPLCVKGNPYKGLLPNQTYVSLPKIPLKYMRVLKVPPQKGRTKKYISPSKYGKMIRR